MIIYFMCTSVVETSCLLPSEKNEQNTVWSEKLFDANNELGCCESLKWSNVMPSIDTDTFSTYYSDCIWWLKLDTTQST